MGSTRRFVPALAPLLFALALPAAAEEAAVKPGLVAGEDEPLAEALAHAARGLLLSSGRGEAGEDAIAAFEEAVRLDPLSRSPWRLLERRLAGPGRAKDRALLLAREARAFGARSDWRRALSAAVAADDAALVHEAVAALAAGVREGNATRESAADLGAAAIALCRIGEGADALHPFRRYLALAAATPRLAPPPQVLATFDAAMRALAGAPAPSAAERVRAADAIFRLFRDAPLACTAQERADALVHAGAPFSEAGDPGSRGLFRAMTLAALRLDPANAPAALFLAADAALEEDEKHGPDPAPEPSLEESLELVDAFAARPEAAGLGYSFELARAFVASGHQDGPRADVATNALARAEARWREEHPGEPLPAGHAAFRLELLLELGLGAEAIADAVASLPDDLRGLDPAFANNLAYTLATEGGDLDLAARLADRSLAQRPGSPETLDTLGWILHLQGEEEEALEMILRSIKRLDGKDPGSAEVYDHAGDVLAALGRGAEASAAWLHAYRLAPSDRLADKLRASGLDPAAFGPAKNNE